MAVWYTTSIVISFRRCYDLPVEKAMNGLPRNKRLPCFIKKTKGYDEFGLFFNELLDPFLFLVLKSLAIWKIFLEGQNMNLILFGIRTNFQYFIPLRRINFKFWDKIKLFIIFITLRRINFNFILKRY